MKRHLFSVPIYYENIDLSKIKLTNTKFEKTFDCGVLSSHNFKNHLDPESKTYLRDKIYNLMKEDYDIDFDILLTSIWENQYNENDYQEKHTHPFSHFSFIIYKDVEKSNTIFHNPIESLLLSYFTNFTKFFRIFPPSIKPPFKKGDIVVFPSFLEHMVTKNSKSVTISGNIILEEKYEQKK